MSWQCWADEKFSREKEMHEEIYGSGGILVINDRNDQEEN